MIDYKTASKDQLKAEMKRLASVVSDTPFGTKKNFPPTGDFKFWRTTSGNCQRNDGWQHMANNPY